MAFSQFQWRSSPAFVTFTVAFAMMTDAITYDMLIPFLPDLLTKRLGVPKDEVAPWLSLSLEVFGAAMLVTNYIAGYIVDRVSSKSIPFMTGIAALLASTLLIFLSRTPTLFVISRLLQGASCALVWTSGVAFLTSCIQEADIGYYMGYALAGATIGDLIGPVMGGLLYENLGHWAVFTAVEVLILIDIVLRVLVRDTKDDAESSPTPSETESASSETDTLLGESQVSANDDQGTFENHTKGNREKLWRIRLLCMVQFVAILVGATVRCAMETAIPLAISNFFGWSSAAAGGVMFALLLPMTVSPIAGYLATSHGPGIMSMIGFASCGALLACLGHLTSNTEHVKILFVVVLGLIGTCDAIATTANSTGVLILVKKLEAAFPTGASADINGFPPRPWPTEGMLMTGLSTSWALGLLLGPGCVSLYDFTNPNGWAHLCLTLAAMCLASSICSIITWRTW